MSSVSRWAVSAAALALASCGGGGGGGGGTTTPPPTTPPPSAPTYALPAAQALSVADVQQVIAQAVAEARARNLPAVIAVTDRVGNVLAVYSMTGARGTATLRAAPNGQNMDAQGVGAPADGDYGFDRNTLDTDDDGEEAIAYAAATGFDAPTDIRAERVTVDGTTLRFSDASAATLRSTPASAPAFATLPAGTGGFTPVTGYYAGGE